jgi:hypothetical protein
MSTELKTKMSDHSMTQFWGGDNRGVCVQITASAPLQVYDTVEGWIQLTMEEAAALCSDLSAFVKREAKRRQQLLRSQLDQLKIAQKTVLHEVVELPENMMADPDLAVLMVSKLCPKTPYAPGESK